MRALRATAQDIKKTFRTEGWRGALRRYGWKLVAGVLVYYIIRDVTLYIIIPYLVFRLS